MDKNNFSIRTIRTSFVVSENILLVHGFMSINGANEGWK